MNYFGEIFGEMRFDGHCKRQLLGIGALAAVLAAVSAVSAAASSADGSAVPYSARCAGMFVREMCACGMLTLYFGLLAYSAAGAFGEWSRAIFSFADSAALALKLMLVLAPFSPPCEDELFLRFAALTADAFLSRRHLRHTREIAGGC